MIVNPKVIIDNNILTCPDAEYSCLNADQIQPNGIDLRLKSVSSIHTRSVLVLPEKTGDIWIEQIISNDGYFYLYSGTAYIVEFYEHVNIPQGLAAYIIGRSTLNRHGIFARSSLYDTGFNNFAGCTLYPFIDVKIRIAERLAQIIFFTADSISLYNGQYQGGK